MNAMDELDGLDLLGSVVDDLAQAPKLDQPRKEAPVDIEDEDLDEGSTTKDQKGPAALEDKPVSQRRRGKMAAAQNQGRAPTLREVPFTEIEEALALYTEVDMQVQRRSPRGNLAHLGRWIIEPRELLQIGSWLQEKTGGGKYRVTCLKPDGSGIAEPIPSFEVEVEGQPRVMKSSDFDNMPGGPIMNNMPAGGGAPPIDPRMLPPFVRAFPPHQQQAWAQQQGITPLPQGPYTQPVASFASDQLAARELDEAKAELRRERAAREKDRRDAEARQSQLDQRIEAMERRHLEETRRLEDERNRQQLEAIRQEQARDREAFKEMIQRMQSAPKGPDMAALVAAAAPVLTAFVSTNTERQNKSLEVQSQGLNNLLQATLQKTDHKPMLEMAKTLAPIVAPMLAAFWEAKSPKAQADLVATMAEQQLTSISMMSELVQAAASSGGEPPWWMPMVQQTMAGIVQAAETMANKTKGYGDSPRQVPTVYAGRPAAPAQSQAGPGDNMARMVMSNPHWPADMQNEDWYTALVLLHDQRPVQETAGFIADLMQRLDTQKKTPALLAKFWDEADVALLTAFQALPIWQINQPYAKQVIQRIIHLCGGDEEEEPEVTVVGGQQNSPNGFVSPASASTDSEMIDFGMSAPAQQAG